jgi:outer membrane protein assembly factor BamA
LVKVFTKISLFILIVTVYSGCNSIRRVPKNKLLLEKNEISVDNKISRDAVIADLINQKPNSSILGYKLRLNLFNLARTNPDSIYKAKFTNNPKKYKRQSKLLSAKQVERKGKSFLYFGIDNFFKNIGEPPTIFDEIKTEKTVAKFKSYYFNNGYYNATISYKVDTIGKRKVKVKYTINRGAVSTIDSIKYVIASPVLDSVFQGIKSESLLKKGLPFKNTDFEAERNRITNYFRDHGAYDFQSSSISFNIDTIGKQNKTDVEMNIKDQLVKAKDTSILQPYKLYKIKRVNIFTDASTSKTQNTIKDSTQYHDFHLYSFDKLKFKPRAITDAVFIAPNTYYSDTKTNLTSRYLNNLKVFNYPSIQYKMDENNKNALIANVILTPRKKETLGVSFDITRSNIQTFGIALNTNYTLRNIFGGAETLDIGLRGNIGASKEVSNPNNIFFNIIEYGGDTRLNFPRILFPFKIEKIIPKSMLPSTTINLGLTKQTNIGLDKENFTGAITYNWFPKKKNSARLELLNVQYVNNININNYFNIYRSSYDIVNEFAKNTNINAANLDSNGNLTIQQGGVNNYINDVLSGATTIRTSDEAFNKIRSIKEREDRLTENNLIVATAYSFSRTNKTTLNNNSDTFRAKIEAAGNLSSLFANVSEKLDTQNNKKTIFDIEYSQYIKTELEYIKNWDLLHEKVFAFRGFVGAAIPYGNSTSIPFSRSYFAGGSNDNRGWQPYSLGPGSSGSRNDFNEANFKIALNTEFRFKIFKDLKGALFVDAGNIWNLLDEEKDPASVFENFNSLKNIAVGSGFGFRYDLNFFVVRIDLGYKTYNPAQDQDKRWFRNYNLSQTVLNIGINYPF